MTTARHIPIRTCVGCRQRDEQPNLVRIAVRDGAVVVDRSRRVPGRGAYLHYRRECVDRGIRRGGIARGLRCRPSADEGRLLAAVIEGGIAD